MFPVKDIEPKKYFQTLSSKQDLNFSSVQDMEHKYQNSHELSPMEVHNLVKEKLKLKGIHMNKKDDAPNNTNVMNVQYLI